MSSAWRGAFAPPGLRLGAFAAPPLPCWPNSAESAGRWLRARRHSTTAPQPPALLMGRRGKRARQVRPTQTTRAPFPAARSMGSREREQPYTPALRLHQISDGTTTAATVELTDCVGGALPGSTSTPLRRVTSSQWSCHRGGRCTPTRRSRCTSTSAVDTVRFTSTARVPLSAHEILSALPATGAVTRTDMRTSNYFACYGGRSIRGAAGAEGAWRAQRPGPRCAAGPAGSSCRARGTRHGGLCVKTPLPVRHTVQLYGAFYREGCVQAVYDGVS